MRRLPYEPTKTVKVFEEKSELWNRKKFKKKLREIRTDIIRND